MTEATAQDVTVLLQAWSRGDQSALARLIPLVMDELRRLAHGYMRRENPGHILQISALINEAYLKLTGSGRKNWQNRSHFLAICSQLMRQILVDFARAHRSLKRGAAPLPLDEKMLPSDQPDLDLVALDKALQRLAEADERKCRVVELRFFGGLSVDEAAEVLAVSPDTITRDWRLARVWLFRQMVEGQQAPVI
jgi:RNA polymerase sigma factor (TIGR02999 family)